MGKESLAQQAGVAAKYGVPVAFIAATLWLILWATGSGAEGVRAIAVAVFNAPILAICVTVPFIGSLRSALQEKGPVGAIESTSYSRITGLFGAVMVTSFFWAMGNVVLWYLFEAPEKAEDIIDGVWKFFILGAALFLPYAFNQLRSIVTDRQQHNVEMERLKLAQGVAVPGSPGIKVLVNKP
jgi:hypothetical protein